LYAPTEDRTEEELEKFFKKLKNAREHCKEYEMNGYGRSKCKSR